MAGIKAGLCVMCALPSAREGKMGYLGKKNDESGNE